MMHIVISNKRLLSLVTLTWMWIDLGASWHLKFVEFDWVLDDMTALELGVVRQMLAEDSAWSGRYLASETSGSFNAWHLRG